MKREVTGAKKNKIIQWPLFYAALFLAGVILLVATVWWIRNAQANSGKSVNDLCKFYLEEIVERNTRSIVTELDKKTEQMEMALTVLNGDSLKNEEALRRYLSMVQRINGLDVFAMVDNHGMVYTADATFSGISRFSFLSDEITKTQIHIVSSYGTRTMVIIAMPVEIAESADIHVVSCFTGLNIESIVSTEQIQSTENRTFCRLFTKDGENLLNIQGEYPNGRNLFEVWEETATFVSDDSLEKVKEDWANGSEGYTVYHTEKGGDTYVYYKPVPETDLILTVLMRESNIGEVVKEGTQRFLTSSILFLTVVILSLLGICSIFILTMRNVRRSQQENEQIKILGALSNDFSDVFLLDPIHDKTSTMKLKGELLDYTRRPSRSYRESWKNFVEEFVVAEDAQMVLDAVAGEPLCERMKTTSEFSLDYRVTLTDGLHYHQAKFVKIDGDDARFILGIRSIDTQVRAELERKKVLQDALTEAQHANRAKTTFLNNMSHDIRTPMNAIIGFTNIALKQQPSKDVSMCLEKIEESSEHLLTLINDVLDISRIESGKTRFEPIPVNICSVTDSVLAVIQGFLTGRDLTLQVNGEKPEHPYVLADPVRIREVLVNILSNAVKFTEDGGKITFTMEYLQEDREGQVIVRYSVSDTGVGMSKEFVGKVFDEFAQEESGARTQYKGTGLGMSITKRYVELMGGTISVESEKGVGTTVVVELPMVPTSPENVENQELPLTQIELTGVRALLAEDNELNAEIAILQLEEYGMKVTRVADGKEAVETFANSPAGSFDLILMDIMMPRMNGYEATKAIRSMENRADATTIPIIAMTANAFAEDVQASMNAGMNAHIAKPLVMEEVIKIISGNLNR